MAAGDTIFISYTSVDHEWCIGFQVMLAPLAEKRGYRVWADDRIQPGDYWRPAIAEALDRTALALVLVSKQTLVSDYIRKTEIPKLLERGATLVPVLVRDCMWEEVDELASVQWALDPRADGPMEGESELSEAMRDRLLVRVCREVAELLPPREADGAATTAAPPPDVVAEEVISSGTLGPLDGVPAMPPGYVKRGDLGRIRGELFAAGASSLGISGESAELGLAGLGGMGKSVLAAALARDEEVRRRFPDGVLWVTLGQYADLVATQIDLLERLGSPQPDVRWTGTGVDLLRQALDGRRVLLVVDDVWSVAAADAFRVTGAHSRVLYTTRDASILEEVGARATLIDKLSDDAARALVANITNVPAGRLPPAADRVLAATRGVALAVALAAAAVGRGGRPWEAVAEELEALEDTFSDHPYADTFKTMQVGVAALDEELERAYRTLAVYPEDAVVPQRSVEVLWAHLLEIDAAETGRRLATLAGRRLLTLDAGTISFHDLQHEFLLLRSERLPLLHDGLLAAYRALLPSPDAPWWRLPVDEPYIWNHLIAHLRAAGERAAVVRLMSELPFLAVRLATAGAYAAESDLRVARDLHPEDPRADGLLRMLAQWGHLFTSFSDPAQLAPTLASRVEEGEARLAELLPPTYLRVSWGLSSVSPALLRTLVGHTDRITALAFAPDGACVVSGGADGAVLVWSPDEAAPIRALHGTGSPVAALDFDINTITAVRSDGTVETWDVSGRRITTSRPIPTERRPPVAAIDRTLVAVTDDNDVVHVWDRADGRVTPLGNVGQAEAVACSAAARCVVATTSVNHVAVWGSNEQGEVRTLDLDAYPSRGIAISRDGSTIVTLSNDAHLSSLPELKPLATLPQRGDEFMRLAAITPGADQIAVAAFDYRIELWRAAPWRRTGLLHGHSDFSYALALSRDGTRLASGGGEGVVRVWDCTSASADERDGHSDRIESLDAAADRGLLATRAYDGRLILWDAGNGTPEVLFKSLGRRVFDVSLAPDGGTIAWRSDSHAIELWDLRLGVAIGRLDTPDYVRCMRFTADGLLATGGADKGSVDLWDPASCEHVGTLPTGSEVTAIACGRDGRIAAGTSDGTIDVWDAGGERLWTAPPSGAFVGALSLVPDGVLAVMDVALRMARAGGALESMAAHGEQVRSVAASLDGRYVASGSFDNVVRISTFDGGLVAVFDAGAPIRDIVWTPDGLAVAAHSDLTMLELVDG